MRSFCETYRNTIIGIGTVLCVMFIGVGVAIATGFVTPSYVFATDQEDTDEGCCDLVNLDGGGSGGLIGGTWNTVFIDGGEQGDWEPSESPVCTLSASPSTVDSNGTILLSWTSVNALKAAINQGVGSVSSVDGGSVDVMVGESTITYTMTVIGFDKKQQDTCSTTVTVNPPKTSGCIAILKETFNTLGAPLTPVAQFTFKLDGGATTQNDANGNAIFTNVTPGLHQVTEIVPNGWTQLSVTPVNGNVNVTAGETCAAVVFKNKQVLSGQCVLEIEKSVNTTQVSWGEQVEYTINFKNAGTANCTGGGVKVVDVVHTGLTYVSEQHSGNVTGGYGSDPVYKISDRTLRWNADTLTPGETGWVKWKASTNEPSECSAVIPNKAKITSKEYNYFQKWVESNTVDVTVTKDCAPPVGCIEVLKETYDTQGNPLSPVAQFEFKLDGGASAFNNANGNAIFTNVTPGVHQVTEVLPPTWQQLSVTPAGGTVTVQSGEVCAAVVFKNKQILKTPDPVTIRATKIVCEDESDLPNRSGGADITASTASDFLAAHPNCRAEPGWTFEWAQSHVSNPGNNIGAGGAPWTPLAPTDANGVTTIAIPFDNITGDRIWFREQMQDDYIPFKGIVVDTVSAELYCHKDVLNYDNYDFIKNPEEGTTYNCVAWNVQKEPPPGTPECTLDANPSVIDPNGSSTLTWTTKNATQISTDNDDFDLSQGTIESGNDSVSPSVTTTYALTAKGPGGEVTCEDTITVRELPPTPVCSLSASASTIEKGDEVTLSWTSSHTDTLSFDQGIGITTPLSGGSLVVEPDDDITYTGTWTGQGGEVQCSVTIMVDEKGLACEMNISPSVINKGESASLSWGGTNVVSVSIDNGIGVRSVPGSETVAPSEAGNYTYHGEFVTEDQQVINCAAFLEVKDPGCTENCGGGGGGGGGGGRRTPRVTFASFEPEGEVLASYVYLSQVPYTGLDLGPVGTVLYWLMLGVWSAAAAYLVLFNVVPFALRRTRMFGTSLQDILSRGEAPTPAPSYATATPGARWFTERLPEAPRGYSTHEGFRSFAHNDVLTVDDVVRGLARTDTLPKVTYVPPAPERTVLTSATALPGTEGDGAPHPAYEAWQNAGKNVEPIYTSVEPIYEHVEPIGTTLAGPAYENLRSGTADAHGIHDADVHGFLDALLAADREATFGFLRQMTRSGIAVEKFLTRALHALDDAFRARVEGGTCDPEVLRITGTCSTPALETVVASLTSAVDGTYTKGMTGAKLAVTRALDTLGN